MFYATVQVTGEVTLLDADDEVAAVLRRQLAKMEPESDRGHIKAGPSPYGRMIRKLRAARLPLTEVRARFKFGGNKPPKDCLRIADRLLNRRTEADLKARDHLLQRLFASLPGYVRAHEQEESHRKVAGRPYPDTGKARAHWSVPK